MRRALVAAAVLVLAGCGERRETPAPRPVERVATILQDDAVFLHRSEAETVAAMDTLRDLGVDWLRITAGWSVIAPEPESAARPAFDDRDPEAYPPGAWQALDRAVGLARSRGLRVNVDIAFWAPRWAVSRAAGRRGRHRRGVDAAAYGRFAEAVARRYPDAVAFTVWNEPNHDSFLLPQWEREAGRWEPAAPRIYREMVRAAVPAIRRAAPDALVLIGGTASIGEAEPSAADSRIPPLRFLRELACVDGELRPLDTPDCRGYAPLAGDGWSHHPYSNELAPWQHDPAPDDARMGDLDRLIGLLARLEGRFEERLPVYVTEYGYQTNPPDPTRPFSPEDQARFLAAAEHVARAHPEVRATAQFLLRDLPPRPGPDPWGDFQSGLLFADGRPKPAERAFAHPLDLVARGDRIEAWGLVRPGHGAREVRLAVREPGGAWREAARVRTADDGTFTHVLDASPRAEVRLDVRTGERWRTVNAVAGARR